MSTYKLEKFTTLRSKPVIMEMDNIDTDQIIPARFLTTTSREGLGQNLFNDWRYGPGGAPKPDFVLNKPEMRERRILVAGHNFGCGSSREHAPWALYDYGIRAVLSTEIADIFRSNALKNGILPVQVSEAVYGELLNHPEDEIEIDLDACEIRLKGSAPFPFTVEPFARYCLLTGLDQMGFLLAQEGEIDKFEAAHS